MNRNDLLERIRRNGLGIGIVDRFLPFGAQAGLEGLIDGRRHEVEADAFLTLVSIRAVLHKHGRRAAIRIARPGRSWPC